MYEVFHEEYLFEFALFLGEELLLSAVKEPANGLSWRSEIKGLEQTRHNLTGFSHGAAGMGYGLLELFRKSSDKRFVEAADQAFNYETLGIMIKIIIGLTLGPIQKLEPKRYRKT